MLKIIMLLVFSIVLAMIGGTVNFLYRMRHRLQPETQDLFAVIAWVFIAAILLSSLTKKSPRDAKVDEYYRKKIYNSYQPPLAETVTKDRFAPGSIFKTTGSIFDTTGSIFDEF